MSTSRPVRERKQPLRNRDKVELDLKLIQQLETCKNTKTKANSDKSDGKLLVAFINAINQSSRENQDEPKQTNLGDKNNDAIKRKCDQDPKQFTKPQRIKNNPYNRIQNKGDKLPEPKYSGFNQRPRTASNYISGKQTKMKNTIPLSTQGGQSNNNFNNVKTFKRHSFHIAIAYRIHLERLKDKEIGNNRTQMLDPTYPAKKLKRDQCGSDQ